MSTSAPEVVTKSEPKKTVGKGWFDMEVRSRPIHIIYSATHFDDAVAAAGGAN